MENIKVFLTNLGKYNEGVLAGAWVRLPIPADELEEVLERIGIGDEYEEYFISDYESAFLNLNISEFASVFQLNAFAEKLDELMEWETEKFAAIVETECPTSVSAMLKILSQLDDFDLLTEVDNEEKLGQYFAGICGTFSMLPQQLQNYIDFRAYGEDIHQEGKGIFSSYGYVIDNR